MAIHLRSYDQTTDYRPVGDFLIRHYRPGNADGNFLESNWEYMHGHPYLDRSSLGKIAIWEEGGEIVGVAHYESVLGEAFFEFHPDHLELRSEMLDYAETHLAGQSEDGRRLLRAYVNDFDESFLQLVQSRGYQADPNSTRPMYSFDFSKRFPDIHLPPGFRLTSLAEECDWAKVERVMWRGFNHPGEPRTGPEVEEERRKMFDTPRARRDLKIAVAAPGGEFVAWCGMFYEPVHRVAYVEPVATDPGYRRLGLGKAAVLEGIRRCATLGAEEAFVGSSQAFYQAIGFKKAFLTLCWVKELG